MSTPVATARLEARISTELHSLLKRAAEIQGRSVTDFVVSAVQAAARSAIADGAVLQMALADQEFFAQALIKPPQANAALKRAFARRSKLLGSQ